MFETINPFTLEQIKSFQVQTDSELNTTIGQSDMSFREFRKISIEDRASLLLKLADVLEEHKAKYACQITLEMGKPISQATAEIEKSAWVCRYYSENGREFLSNQEIKTDASRSYISYEPLGVILAIMPWNFPFWQVFRFLAPALMAGNTALIKHSPNTFGTSLLIEEAVKKAGYPAGIVQNLIMDVEKVSEVIARPEVKAVTLTGSGRAGSSVAQGAGKHIKKTVLELGGSNAFIVLHDADIDKAVEIGVTARMQNNGQSCIAAKRFLIHESVYDEYVGRFKEKMESYKMGDPFDEDVNLGPLARLDLAKKLEKQVEDSVKKGAKILIGGKRDKAFYEPTILTNISESMPAFEEELFGPVAAFMPISDVDHAIDLSNLSEYGLGVSVFTNDTESILRKVEKFEDGAVFINDMVKSDPRLPFGGTKSSGYGRELGHYGLKEFLNIKTVYVS